MTMPPSIRSAAWSAAQCVRHFCRERGLSFPEIDAFCGHLEDAATARSLADWEASGRALALSGLGDPMPQSLSAVSDFAELIACAHEVSASQLYGAWEPETVTHFLTRTATIAGVDPAQVASAAAARHAPDDSGWGLPITLAVRAQWEAEGVGATRKNA